MNLDMERQIHEISAVCDYVQGLKRSPKKLWLSFDEWNVWYRANSGDHTNGRGKFAPKLLEEVYNLEDALLVGGLLNTLMRRSDRVKVGCLAQIVNVIAPLVTNEKGILRQSTYYPYAMALEYGHGRILDLHVESETYPISAAGLRGSYARDGQVPFVDVVATYDAKNGRVAVFALNRDLSNERELALNFDDLTPTSVVAAKTITGSDLKAFNTFEEPNKVVAAKLDGVKAGSKMSIKLPPRSYSVVQLAV
jgi:alpha-N-arabinofuranosidase